jgi:hypothetical protein
MSKHTTMPLIVILPDGETWASLAGVTLARVTPDMVDALASGATPRTLAALAPVPLAPCLSVLPEASEEPTHV